MATTTRNGGAGDAAARLNSTIDCVDLAVRLGMEQPGGKGNFKSPHHPDKAPSVSVYAAKAGKGSRFHDFSTGEGGGPIDMLMWHSGMDFVPALKELAKMYGVKLERPGGQTTAAEQTLPEFIASNCLQAARSDGGRAEVLNYLEGRGIARVVVENALNRGTLGLNTYTSKRSMPGEIGHGGLAVAFVVRAQLNNAVVAVDMRYIDPETNGGVKSQSQGEKALYPWCSDWRRLADAQTVYVVESSINAMSIESCLMPRTAALAVRGTGNVENIDWSFLRGKQVIACFDNDKPQERGPSAGYGAGQKAAWRLHELLTGLDISCMLVDQSGWVEDPDHDQEHINDINDWLKEKGAAATEVALKKIEGWMIPGMSGDSGNLGKPRIWLPQHDYHAYWKYRVQFDFTRAVSKMTPSEDSTEPPKLDFQDVAGFRVAAISRVTIASPTSTMTGDEDHSPATVFALSVQTARHGAKLQRRVVDDEKLHNVDVWKKLGPIFAPSVFARMINIWERAASIGARDAINFVGLAWRGGRTVLNEGPDCFFADPRQQCPYNALSFPSGQLSDAREVMAQFQGTFKGNAASIILVWALGAHLKAFLGFWPHFVMQAEKGTGKTTIVKRMERAIAMTMFSRQTLGSEFRQLTSISYTSHPVGWEEISAGKQDTINKAVANLQESYMYSHTRRGAELMDFLLCAPVLLAGEDVPVKSLQGKVVRTELAKTNRGAVIPEDMPIFPVRQWLQFLAGQRKDEITAMHKELVEHLTVNCIAKREDAGAERMVANYAGLALAWQLLCEFADVPAEQGRFIPDLTAVMNAHIKETESDRQPWAWIIDKLLGEIATGAFRYPYKFDVEDEVPVLCVRTGHIMDHISQSPQLREFWDGLPVKTAQVLKKQLAAAGVLATDLNGSALMVERTVKGNRVAHMVCLSLPALEQFGLHAVVPKATHEDGHPGEPYGAY